jgi:hypothetical protein
MMRFRPFYRSVLFVAAIFCSLTATANAAGSCSANPRPIHGGAILATMSYWARPGKADELFRAVSVEDRMIAKNGLQPFRIFRGTGGKGPDVVWAMTFRDFKAHNAWYNATNKIHETPSEIADDKRANTDTLRMVHSHYLLHDAWAACPQ